MMKRIASEEYDERRRWERVRNSIRRKPLLLFPTIDMTAQSWTGRHVTDIKSRAAFSDLKPPTSFLPTNI